MSLAEWDTEQPPGKLVLPRAFHRVSRRRSSLLLCAVAAMGVLLSACSSSGGKPKARASSIGSRSPSTGTASDCVQTAPANARAGMTPMKLGPPGSLDTSSIRGKKVSLIDFASKNNVVELTNAEGLQQALRAVGATLIPLDGQGTPDIVAQDIQSAIAQRVAGIVDDGWPPSLVPVAVADAKAAKIPVVFSGAEPNEPLSPGVVANLGTNSFRE